MKIIRGNSIEYTPASHEEHSNPAVLKKVLINKNDVIDGRLQMINWALLPVGKSFQEHYHEDMDEVFIIIKGLVKIQVEKQTALMGPGDAVVIPAKASHVMSNTGDQDAKYIALGVSSEQDGKTVIVQK